MADVAATPDLAGSIAPRPTESRWRGFARTAFPFLVVGVIWEVLAHSGLFPPRLFPPVETIVAAFVRLTVSGVLPHHAFDSLVRLVSGFALAAVIGVSIGIAMGRSQFAEDVFLPLVSIGAPIPGLAYAPLFLLWFGLGNVTAVLLVGVVSAFPIVFNTWTGVKAVKEIWVRAAQAMGAGDRALFRLVILPGALPYILTGLRLGLAQAWRILVGVEMLAAVQWGLGWLIFGAREFLATDVMLAGIIVIALIGLALEKLVFQRVEAVHPGALGHADMTARTDRWRKMRRAAGTLVVLALVYEAVARSGYFPAVLLPTLPGVARALVRPPLRRDPADARGLYARPRARRLRARGRDRPAARHRHGAPPRRGELRDAARERADADPVARLGAGVHPVVRPRRRGDGGDRVLCRAVSDAAQHLDRGARGQFAVAARRAGDGRRASMRCSGR